MACPLLPHIRLDLEDGRTVVTVEDAELFDLVEDHLLEDFDLEYEFVDVDRSSRPWRYRMIFPAGVCADTVAFALKALDAAELEWVFLLNNPTSEAATIPASGPGAGSDYALLQLQETPVDLTLAWRYWNLRGELRSGRDVKLAFEAAALDSDHGLRAYVEASQQLLDETGEAMHAHVDPGIHARARELLSRSRGRTRQMLAEFIEILENPETDDATEEDAG